MLHRFREHFGAAGLIVAIFALVAALAGGAVAATGGSSGKATASAAKGKPGPRGPKGPKGPKGAAGAPGATGAPGAKGDAGAAGSPGAAGKSVVIGNTAPSCLAGGKSIEVEGSSATKQAICNGEDGLQGVPGEPWTAGGVLPTGATETGSWGDTFSVQGVAPISFAIPLNAALPAAKTVIVPPAGSNTSCDNGTGEAASVGNPEADEGFLCVFVGLTEGAGAAAAAVLDPSSFSSGAGKPGAFVALGATGDGFVVGTWAVTGS